MTEFNNTHPAQLIDRFNRRVDYVRLSVTDRCDFRCIYCMSETMHFAPRAHILTLEELGFIARAFVELGVKKIRLTGGEPLIRHNVMALIKGIGQMDGLQELTLTTNGTRLEKMASQLRDCGVKRINISIDSLNEKKFKQITRTGDLSQVLRGIDAAKKAGFKRIKLNSVILNGRNDDEIIDLVSFARNNNVDISFIEEMPLGIMDEHKRTASFCSSEDVFNVINQQYPLTPTGQSTNGPSRYHSMHDSNTLIGFISAHSHNFCHLCNRVRVTVEGRLLLCLGNEHSVDLRDILRRHPGEIAPLKTAIVNAMPLKPERHNFQLHDEPQIVRFMNMTGG